ncbi:hypothetical protein Poly30_09390 [Planctomycetes bacterium Poly30]|uniref:Uncharacterized protein n=1 Tax=Saltatorellus ferox TaxID=2528018 RepID=A0A518EMX6_9BACT|nr:hypothetical protein Poly30_09390 [Planctomycetes bacterium Poly30]
MLHLFAGLPLSVCIVTPATADISFPAGEAVRLWVNRRQVIAIEAAGATEEDREWPVMSSDASLVVPLGTARILAGQRFGSLAVRALAAGGGELEVGGARVRFDARSLPEATSAQAAIPAFVAPAEGAVLSGKCAIGVEIATRPGVPTAETEPILDVPGIGEVRPSGRVASERGPEQRWVFEIDANAIPEGPQLLRVRMAGEERSGDGEESLFVRVVHSGGGIHVEAEAALQRERPDEFGGGHPPVSGDPLASGGAAVVLRGYQPTALAFIDVPEAGSWQVFATMRGRIGAGAFPSVSLSVDTDQPRLGSVRVVSESWQRLPIGLPIELEAGEHAIHLRLGNPVSEGRAEERHLYIDSVDLVVAPAMSTASGSMMGMEGAMASSMDASMMSGSSAGSPDEASGLLADGLWVGFHEVFDGLPMNGDLRIEGLTSWRGGDSLPAPRVDLLVDGEAVQTMQATEPIFEISRAELGPGEHTFQLRAEQIGGRVAVTPAQTLFVRGATGSPGPTRVLRFGMEDERWLATGALLQPAGEVSGSLELPADLEGWCELRIDARGPGAPHHGLVTVRVEGAPDDRGERPLLLTETLEIRDWWRERSIGELSLPAGSKRVVVEAEPQPDGAASERPSLYLRSLVLERLDARPKRDFSPPGVEILYPADGATVEAELDAVVADVFDDRRVATAELMVDGRSVAAFARVPSGAGYAVLPLLARDLAPGTHTLAVRVFDEARNEAESVSRTVTVRERNDGAAPGAFPRAVHLLNRMGLGPDPGELADVLLHGEAAWVESQFTVGVGHEVARGRALADLGGAIPYQAQQLALQIALTTDQPLRERFALFLDNHFSTWADKTGMTSEWGDHRRYQDVGLAPFGELLWTAMSSPVMLVYLDQQKSFRGRLNENLARELLELHTVGVNGGYDQADVTALAGLLCGLTVGEEAPPDGAGQYLSRVFRFAPDLADPAPQTVLGARFEAAEGDYTPFERFGAVLDHLAAHPMTARFWAHKLAEHFVGAPAPEALVEDLAERFLATGGDTRELLRCIAEHPAFWAAMGTGRVASPLDFGVRFARATTPRHLHGHVQTLMASAGMGLFDHEAPDGYPEDDEAWVDSNGLLARWRLAQNASWAARALVPEELRRAGRGDSQQEYSELAIDHASFRLLGRLLGPDSRAAALAYLAELGGDSAPKEIDQMCVLLTRFPEANLR